MRALLVGAALVAGANPGSPAQSGMTIAVTVPETAWNSPDLFAMTLLTGGDVQVQDNRTGSRGWTIARQLSGPGAATLTVTVLSTAAR